MRKKQGKFLSVLLALALVLNVVLLTPLTVTAENRDGSVKYTNGLVVNGVADWNSGGGDQYLLEGDFDVTVTFENTPFIRNAEWSSNFVFEIFGGADTKGITIRADNWGWTYGEGAQEPILKKDAISWSWDDYVDMCNKNPIVTLNLKKTSDNDVTAYIEFKPSLEGKAAATETYVVTYPNGVPASMRAQVGADGGKIKILECRYNTAAVKRNDLTVGGFVSATTDPDNLSGDFSLVYTFHNATQNTAENWFNYTVEVWGDGFGITARADIFGWGYNGTEPDLVWETAEPVNWDAFRADMTDADVTATIERLGSVITFTYDITGPTGNTYHFVGTTAELAIPETLYAHLTGEQVVLSDIEVMTYKMVETEPEAVDGDIIYGKVEDRVSVHDPSIIKDEETGYYYVFGSHMAWARSTDLVQWQTFTNNINADFRKLFAKEAEWAAKGSSNYDLSGNLWAPDVIWNEAMGKWCMYMSVNGDKWYTSIALLTADNIEGPYTHAGTVVYSGFTSVEEAKLTDFYDVLDESEGFPDRYLENRNGNHTYGMNAIDPCVTYDEDGNLWMTYGSWFGGIYMLKLDNETGLRDYDYPYETVKDKSDEYQGIKIAGGYHSSGEASYLEKIGDYWYLFMSYGGLTANGGYNIRVFRSEDITGPYVDLSGDTANYTAVNSGNINGTVGNRLMSYYQWSYMDKGQVAQGHNSAFVNTDGKAYVVYHTRFNDGTEGHQVRVHQLFVNQDGWLVAAPFEYAGESLSVIDKSDVAGRYEVLFHTGTDYGSLECVTAQSLIFEEDGTLSGALEGTWSLDGYYVTLTCDSKTYKGVFVNQKLEEQETETLCFTVIGSDEISVWGYKYPYSDEEFIEMAAQKLDMPIGTFGQDLTLPSKGLYEVEIAWSSGNTEIIADDGTVTLPDEDTVVTMTATMTLGKAVKVYEYPVKVFSDKKDETEKYLIWEYFTDAKQDLSSAGEGTIRYPNPFNGNNVLGISTYNGVSIEFEVATSAAMEFLSNIFSINNGARGGLYFTGGSYLGYNATGGWFDANVDNSAWVAGTDFIGSGAKFRIDLLPDGFEVYVNDELAYTQEDIGGKVPGSTAIDSYASVLGYLRNTAAYLNFGWGSWWDGGFKGTISNVKLYVEPVEYAEVPGCYVYYEDYNNTFDTGWLSPNAQGNLSVKSDGDAHNGYMNYAEDAGVSGNRGAYTNFPAEANLSGTYIVETDIKLTPGTVADRSVSQFAITGTDAAYDSDNYNYGILSGYILKLSTAEANSTVYYINDSQQSVDIPANTWIHIKASVTDGTDVLLEITIDGETRTFTAEVNGEGVLNGMYLLRGRGRGAAAIDNVAVIQHICGDAVVENEKPATCIDEGSYDEVIYCTECGEEISRVTVTTPALGHIDEDGDGYCDRCELCLHEHDEDGYCIEDDCEHDDDCCPKTEEPEEPEEPGESEEPEEPGESEEPEEPGESEEPEEPEKPDDKIPNTGSSPDMAVRVAVMFIAAVVLSGAVYTKLRAR